MAVVEPVQAFDAVFPLTSLNGSNGFRVDGITNRSRTGDAVANAGDINGDGIDDLIIGAYEINASYVVFGKTTGFGSTFSLSNLNGSNGFKLTGVKGYDYAGYSVSGAGDINGDGIDDLIIGAYGTDHNGSYSGSSYVVFGSTTGFAAEIALSSLNGTNGFRIDGTATYDRAGKAVSGAGDINGDGIDDLIIGASTTGDDAGSAYVLFGNTEGFGATLNLSTLDGSTGFRVDAASSNDYFGWSVSGAGDVNNDGIDDIIIGALEAGTTGFGYVVFGSTDGFAANFNASSLDGSNGFRLDGVAARDNTGFRVSAGGDINGDGIDDVLISARKANNGGYNSGSTYVVFGRSTAFDATLALSSLDGSNGFRLDGVKGQDYSGWELSGAGDINGDGFADLVIGAQNTSINIYGEYGTGISYVVFGSNSGFSATRSLSSLDGSNGFLLYGASGDNSGTGVSISGDFNGDGVDDLVIGARSADTVTENDRTGAVYVVFGEGVAAPPDIIFKDGFEN